MKRWLVLVGLMVMFSLVQAQDALPTSAVSSAAYVVNLATNPAIVEANQPFTLTVKILTADDKTPVTVFDEVHTKLLHLIVVSQDLTEFMHVHPEYQGDGVFVLKDLVLADAVDYVIYADFTPTGDHQQYVRNRLSVNGAIDTLPNLVASPHEVTAGALQVSLDRSDGFKAGAELGLKFHVTDEKTGAAINNLDEYLGAAGHLVVIDEANQTYIHTHPAGHDMAAMSGMTDMATATPEMAGMVMPRHYGPDLEFMTAFPDAGLWAMWLQVQYEGEVYTFPFVVEVSGTVEGTPEAHAHG